MKFLVLGCGMQGRAVIYDLLQSSDVKSVLAADVDLSGVEGDPLLKTIDSHKKCVMQPMRLP